ncbi:dUMP phosphatase [Acrocarpospora pleiomorpha]|uniref:dUMP phosphatase n=1 Tax=Acrocarpospora pleiomorpha TaxID=90975 RepID=A0A5M3XTG7_9ACTN|nr:dUMP phosphatase [Acrocarpospora pleiomorpha]
MQRLALFDLDNTLIDLDAAFKLWASEFADDHGLGPAAVDWLLAIDRAGNPHRAEFFTMARERFALADSVEELWARYRTRMPHLVRCPAEVLTGLAALRTSGWSVGIVTNGMADNQLGKIQRTGLADVVDAWAISGAEGIRKPDIGLFDIAAKRCGKSLADGGWATGDNLISDIQGGNEAGLRTIWINHKASSNPDHAAHQVVSRIEDAIRLLLTI